MVGIAMKNIIRIIILIIALGLMGFSGYKLLEIYREYKAGESFYEDYVEKFVNTSHAKEVGKVEEEDTGLTIDFDALLAENPDIVGWIYSEGTVINYPIVQADDNDYYLRRMLDGNHNTAGSIFMDFRNSPDFSDLNTIIYGHNMKNQTMFGTLKEYRDQDYYEKHPEIYIYTPHKKYSIKLIAGYRIDMYYDIDILPQDWEELKSLYDEVVGLSTFQADIPLKEGDRLVTLATCREGDNTQRYLLIGIANEL